MKLHNLKISFKNLVKNRFVTVLNLLGLSIGVSLSLLIFAYVDKEEKMDCFIPNSENTYMLKNGDSHHASIPMVEHLKKTVSEIDQITFAYKDYSPQIYLKHKQSDYRIKDLLVVDSSFFKVVQFESIYGDLSKSFSKKNQIVLTEKLAKKIFGNTNPVGKTIHYNATYLENKLLEVAGVLKKFPNNCSFTFDAVLSFSTNQDIGSIAYSVTNWRQQNYCALCSFSDRVSLETINEKLTNINKDGVPEDRKDNMNFKAIPLNASYFEMPTVDIQKHGNYQILFILRILAVLVVILAFINYINLVTAQKLKRIRDIGILKAIGSRKRSIVYLLTMESVIIVSLTCILVSILIYYSIPVLNTITNSSFIFLDIFSGYNLLLFGIILILAIIITGILPGIIMSKKDTNMALKNVIHTNGKNYIRNTLIVLQFTISVILLISILIINQQNNLLTKKEPGFAQENIIYTTSNGNINHNIDAFIDEVKKIPGIDDITFASAPIGYGKSHWGISLLNEGEYKNIGFHYFSVSPNFFDFFDIEILKGKNFTENSVQAGEWIFNETAFNSYQIKDLEKAKIKSWNNKHHDIIGVAKDFNFQSMHVPISKAAFKCHSKANRIIYLKLHPKNFKNIANTLQQFDKVWNEISPNFPLEIQYLNKKWEALYKKELQFQKILKIATVISILLSCFGLICLTFFIVETRTKEIGIRKVNGAKTIEIVKMLNKDLLKWIFVAFVLACPVAYVSLSKWLDNFAYKTDLSWWIFVLAGVISLFISMLTVSFQSVHAAKMNPIKALRYE